MEKHNTAKDFLSALDRLENDALSSRDGYGYSSGDAEKIRRVLAENEQLRKERDELASALNEYYVMYGDRSIISSVDDLLEKAGILND